MRSIRANHNQVAVSAYTKETAVNTFQDMDLSLLVSVGDIISLEKRRENNADELTGREEADTIYDNGQTSSFDINFEKAQPQHYAFLYAYALGNVETAAAGSGFLKTITPMDGDLDMSRSLPSFTAGQRLGKAIVKQRFASMFVDEVTASFARDEWCKLTGSAKGTGKMENNIKEESITATLDATSLSLSEAVAGSTDSERTDAIHNTRVLDQGVWKPVVFSAVSSGSPAEITITAPGAGTETTTYKVLYAQEDTGWMNFPERISETPLRVSEVTFNIGGQYDGSAFVGGKEMGAEINSIEHSISNNGLTEFTPGAQGAYATQYFREGRTQTLKLNREMRDFIVQNYMDQNEYFGASILAQGGEYETGHRYSVEIIFPKLGVLNAPVSANGKRLAEAGDLSVLEEDTYGSVIVKIKNLQQNYAA